VHELTNKIRALGLRIRYSRQQLDRELNLAAIAGRARLVNALIAAAADINANSTEALRSAAMAGHDGVVRILIRAGADIHARNDAALRAAAMLGHLGVVRELITGGASFRADPDQALREAATSGNVSTVTELLDAAADQSTATMEEDVVAMRVILRGISGAQPASERLRRSARLTALRREGSPEPRQT
jgi:ankyrin repeat protein